MPAWTHPTELWKHLVRRGCPSPAEKGPLLYSAFPIIETDGPNAFFTSMQSCHSWEGRVPGCLESPDLPLGSVEGPAGTQGAQVPGPKSLARTLPHLLLKGATRQSGSRGGQKVSSFRKHGSPPSLG